MFSRLDRWFRRQRITRKLTAVGVLAATASGVMAGALLLAFDVTAEYADESREVSILANMAGINTSAAVAFHDRQAATDILGALRSSSRCKSFRCLRAVRSSRGS